MRDPLRIVLQEFELLVEFRNLVCQRVIDFDLIVDNVEFILDLF